MWVLHKDNKNDLGNGRLVSVVSIMAKDMNIIIHNQNLLTENSICRTSLILFFRRKCWCTQTTTKYALLVKLLFYITPSFWQKPNKQSIAEVNKNHGSCKPQKVALKEWKVNIFNEVHPYTGSAISFWA